MTQKSLQKDEDVLDLHPPLRVSTAQIGKGRETDSVAGSSVNGTLEGLRQRLSLASEHLCVPVELHSHVAPVHTQGCVSSACPLGTGGDTASPHGLLITSE